jgi:hypothetical protein
VFLTLQPIPEEHRRPEQELWTAFDAERPRVLGALLDAVVEGLKRLPQTSRGEVEASCWGIEDGSGIAP